MERALYSKDLRERLDRLIYEVIQLKSLLIYQVKTDETKSMAAWDDLDQAADEVSTKWSGYSALEEIVDQRKFYG